MTDVRIINYYLLSTVRMGSKAHIIDSIPEKKLGMILTKKEVMLFLRERDGHYMAREVVVGGRESTRERPPIIVIGQ